MPARRVLQRVLVPSIVKTAIYYFRFRALVSARAEVDLSSNLVIGRGAEISAFAKVKAIGGPLHIGSRSSIGTGCFLSAGYGGIRIGDDVMIASNVVIVANNHRYDRVDVPMNQQGGTSQGIVIEDDVWIGANSCIMDGAHIETGVVVAAGSVVSGKVAKRSVVVGNPARSVFERR